MHVFQFSPSVVAFPHSLYNYDYYAQFHFAFRMQYSRQTTVDRFIKRGNPNIKVTNIPNKFLQYTKDIINTFITIKWRWVIFAIVVINWSFYSVLAGFFMLDAYVSGDFTPNKTSNFCINGVSRDGSFKGFLLLGIETVTSTGYGYKYPTEHCNFLPLNMTIGHLMFFMLDGALISALFFKITRPQHQNLPIFSKKVVVCLRNGKLCLVFRLHDLFKRHSISPQIRAYMVQEKSTERDYFGSFLTQLDVEDFGLLLWPTEITHVINEDSPFYKLDPYDLFKNMFEIVVEVGGSSMATSQPSISRHSYLNKDVLWGYRFLNCLFYDKQNKNYYVNLGMFNQTIYANIPLCGTETLLNLKNGVQIGQRLEDLQTQYVDEEGQF